MSKKRLEIMERIEVILKRQKITVNIGEINEQLGLLGQGIGLDSVEVLQLVADIEEEFELTIDDEELSTDHFRSVGSLITFIEERS